LAEHRKRRTYGISDRDRSFARHPDGKVYVFWRDEIGYFRRRLSP
jgi:hypothetical protein